MNLINEEITHKVFGEGNIVDQDGAIITIDFNEDIKKFVYPDAFKEFITLNDQNTAKSLKKAISEKEMKEEALERKREQEQEQQMLEHQRREQLKNNKIHESSQIVFWLDDEEHRNAFTDWQVSTGKVQSGENKGQPNRAARVRPNSAGLLTVRASEQKETERRIVGLYMVSETFSGNLSDDGMIPSHKDFRIELTDQESKKMLFWNYHINRNHPHRTTWNSGDYRYYENVLTARILKDIISLKTDEEEIRDVEKFLEYFCQMNALDMENIPKADGALKHETTK